LLLGWLCGPVGLVFGLAVDGLAGGHPLVDGFVWVSGRGALREQFLSSYRNPWYRCDND